MFEGDSVRSYWRKYNEMARSIIDKFSEDVFLIYVNRDITCTCRKEGSGHPEPRCKRCLGTGYKIKIRKTTANIQGDKVYINCDCDKNKMHKDDLIVFSSKPYIINDLELFKSYKGIGVYYKLEIVPKKLDVKIFMENFQNIIRNSK